MNRFVLLSFVGLICAAPLPAADRPPNIIHILADDVGYDDVGPFGCTDILTPNLDRLARQGRKFTSFYAPGCVCTPSRAAILTGCYAPRVSLPSVLFPFSKTGINDKEVTIAQLLKEKGYATALIGKWHLGHQKQFLPTKHGFDHYFGTPYPNDHEPVRVIWEKQANQPDWRPPPLPLYRDLTVVEEPAELDRLPHRFTVEAVKFIKENRHRPFYLHLANIETHTPYFVNSRFQGLTKGGAYCDSVASLDWTVGEIEAILIDLGLTENTLVVFSSDNGPLLDSPADLPKVYGRYGTTNTERKHKLRGGKGSVWEGGARVACLMRWPGKIPAGSTCDEVIAGFDFYTTFAKVGGAEIPKDRIIDGKDITPLMFGEKDAKSPHDAFYYYQNLRLGAVRSGKWKLMFGGPNQSKPALYDLDADIAETSDVLAAHPDEVKRLQALADKARDDIGDSAKKITGKNRRPPGEAAHMAASKDD
jgi:arylsulfatase A-like enzyme